MTSDTEAAATIAAGRATLGIELGSTRIKACLIGDDPSQVLATGGYEWENRYVDGLWTYPLEEVWTGLQAAYAELAATVEQRYGTALGGLRAIGVSAMMHGYLPFDADGELLAPFRTWRNTNTGVAAAELSARFGVNIPLRWSVAHWHQAVTDGEAHVGDVAALTTLAGYVHWRLTGRNVLGVGDASGMFPIDPATRDYDAALLASYDQLTVGRVPDGGLRALLPEVLVAGADAGSLTAEGALLLDPTGALPAGIPLCPPEGDAGTGMVATNAVAPRTGNVSAGTSIFAMAVLERPLAAAHEELDLVTTPSGDLVAMVHCNNGASELGAWVRMFARFAAAAGAGLDEDAVYAALFREALDGEADAGGLVAYNLLAGEPIVGLEEGRPLFVRTPDSRFTLANAMRAQLYAVFASLAIGMRVLDDEGVRLERMAAHGGIFRTAGVAQRLLAGALDTPVVVAESAGEGGAWGVAVLAAYAVDGRGRSLPAYLDEVVFGGSAVEAVAPDPADVAGFAAYLERYEAGLAIEHAAITAI